MAKARMASLLPKLVFREHGESKLDRPRTQTLSETDVEMNWVHINRSQSFKTVFLGDSNVGKTCLARLFVDHAVSERTTNTIGFDHHVKQMKLDEGIHIKLQIWDTAGMEQFRNALITKYYRNADGIVFVYDITKYESFQSVETWIGEVKQYCGSLEKVEMVLIGNKIDQEHHRKVPYSEAEALAARYGMVAHIELSAKNIEDLPKLEDTFSTLAEHMYSHRETTEMTASQSLRSKDVIRLDDWEIITVPDEPIPHYTYSAHDRARARRQKCAKC